MIKKIFKYELIFKGGEQLAEVELPCGAEVLKVDFQRGKTMLWAIAPASNKPQEKVVYQLMGTGWPIDTSKAFREHVATVIDGVLVWHIFKYIKRGWEK